MKYLKISKDILGKINSMNTINGGVSMTSFSFNSTENYLEFYFSAPSVSGEAFHIYLNNNKLIINTFPGVNTDDESEKYNHPAYHREFDLPFFIDVESIDAAHEGGKLKVKMPYKTGLGPGGIIKKINIKYN